MGMKWDVKWNIVENESLYISPLNECSTWCHFGSSTSNRIWHHHWSRILTANMPRNPIAHERSIKKQVNDTHCYCLYCKAHHDGRGFDKHQAACKIIWQLQHRRKNPVMPLSLENHSEKQMWVEKVINPSVPIEVNFLDNIMSFYQLIEILKGWTLSW